MPGPIIVVTDDSGAAGDSGDTLQPTTTGGATDCAAGLPCTYDEKGYHDCPPGAGQCVDHPETGELFCVHPCPRSEMCEAPPLDCSGEPGALPGVCLKDSDGVPSCFAQ